MKNLFIEALVCYTCSDLKETIRWFATKASSNLLKEKLIQQNKFWAWSCSLPLALISLSGCCSGWPGHVPQDGVRLRQPQRRSLLLPRVRPSSEQPVPTPERPADLRQRGHVGGELPAVPVPGECRHTPELCRRLTLERLKKKTKKKPKRAVVSVPQCDTHGRLHGNTRALRKSRMKFL